jgi:3-deoxy-D-manno-octulosonic-acid transferase
VTGPHTHNFEEIFPVLLAAQGDGLVHSAEELSMLVQKLIANPAAAAQLGTRAKSASDCLRGALSATVAAAESLIAHART